VIRRLAPAAVDRFCDLSVGADCPGTLRRDDIVLVTLEPARR
jgi:hypothetical protein